MDRYEVALDNYRGAQTLRDERFRSCVSRAYYSAHAAVTGALLDAGYRPPPRHHTPPHREIPRLIGQYLAARGHAKVKELRASLRRLYAARIDADYVNVASIGSAVSLAAVRDAASVLRALEVYDDGGR